VFFQSVIFPGTLGKFWNLLRPSLFAFAVWDLGNGWHSLKPVKFDAKKGNRKLLTGGLDISQSIKISKNLRLIGTIL